jgi:hypothetical protein
MNILVLGGSNSRKKSGYTKFLYDEFESNGESVVHFTNLALGANTCLLGMISLEELNDSVLYDVVVVEYSVNDYAMTVVGDVEIWKAAFEGLIRQILRRYPKAIICNVLLGRSNVVKSLWETQIDETKKIAKHYRRVILADVQNYLPSILEPEKLYHDPMHYSLEAQELAGKFVASKILSNNYIQSDINMISPSLYDNNFENVGVIDFQKIDSTRNQNFSNSIISIASMKILCGESVEVDVPGSIICIVFVSAQGCGSFSMTSENKKVIIHTLHRGVRDGKYGFLPLSAYGSWWKESAANKVIIEAIPFTKGPADWPVDFLAPSSDINPVVYMYKILYRKI